MASVSLSGSDFRVGEWLVRPSQARIERGAEIVHVTPRAMTVLVYLAHAPGRVVPRNELLDAVWPGMAVTHDALSQCIVELRKAFHDDSRHSSVIETIPRLGVRLVAPVALETTAVAAQAASASASVAPHADTSTRPRERKFARVLRLAASPNAALVALVIAALGSGAFWWSEKSHLPWRDPLAQADYTKLTDFIGAEEHAAISRDGRLVAFLSDRDGAWDVFVGQIGAGDFQNLTHGSIPEMRNPAVRMLGFSPTGSDVVIWTKTTDSNGRAIDQGWTVPVLGGSLRRGLVGIAELDWSPDGEWVVSHPSAPGDPLFIASAHDENAGRRVHVASEGIHCHFPTWSRDGETIYFVRGFVPDEMDVWRVRASGGEAERLTWHNSRVSFPVMLDEQTLLYLATAADGSGPWVHALDLERGTSRRLKSVTNPYTSLAASSDGNHLLLTEAHPTASLWRVSLGEGLARAGDVAQIPIPTQRGVSPRFGPDFVAYRAPKAGTDGLWRHEGQADAKELWSGLDGRVVAGPALSADGERIAFAVHRRGRTQLYVMNSDGSDAHKLAEELDVRGAPTWSPDGEWIAVAALVSGEPRLFKISATANADTIQLGDDYALDPVWAPSGRFLLYTGRDVGTAFQVKAVSAEGEPHLLPTLFLNRGSRRLDFLGADDDAVVILKGALSHKEFWVINLRSGEERPLTDLGAGPIIGDFDVSADGRSLVFDRVREESDIVRVELAKGSG